ncbi:MAG TPA: hypothetical protein VHZ55_14500 [Bryobacteraceae bacterium]|jgi:hypothetical protein|nr:hypothetical protein [Bryobacteraceae bacterium]
MRLPSVLCLWLLVSITSADLSAQAVVSTHSGTINYSEGVVFVGDSPVDQKIGTFQSVGEGATLRTEKGRAEVLLTPGVFLRIDENSAIRMVSNALNNTRVEFLRGAAILDSNDATSGNPCVLVYRGYQLRFRKPGVYRLNSEPDLLQTYTGEAEIQKAGEPTKTIDESKQFFFGIGMDVEKYGDGTVDAFSEWARNRAESIAADNRVGSQSTADPDAADPNNSPFALPAPAVPNPGWSQPSFGLPNYGTLNGTVLVDNGFVGPWGPYNGLPFLNPTVVIFAFPRFPRRYPVLGTSPHRTGYPTVAGLRTGSGYPRLNTYHPAYIPARSTYNYMRPSVGRVSVGAPRMTIPRVTVPHVSIPRVSGPTAVRPMAMPHR